MNISMRSYKGAWQIPIFVNVSQETRHECSD